MLTSTYLTNRVAIYISANQCPLQLISKHLPLIKLGNDLQKGSLGASVMYIFTPKQTKKLSSRAIKCVFVGYSNTQKG